MNIIGEVSHVENIPSASYSMTLRVEFPHQSGALGSILMAVGEAGGLVGAVDIVRMRGDVTIRDITVNSRNSDHGRRIVEVVDALPDTRVINVSDRTFLMHLGGKIEIRSKHQIRTRDDLSMVYTPGVARVCRAIAEDPERAFNLTIKRNTVAVVTDGTAVLGLGDIGPAAAMPVMEGKAALFKQFAGVDAWPVCLDTQDTDAIVDTVRYLAPVYGGINLEDIAAPRCFEIEARLREALDIPVFHDDQHGTAIVVLAALRNALRVVGKKLSDVHIVVSGVGAAGSAIIRLLHQQGASHLIGCDRTGALHRGQQLTEPARIWIAENTNPDNVSGPLGDVLVGADVFIGVSAPNLLDESHIATMATDSIVFALANPDPEVDPMAAQKHAAIVATGRSDYPNQINNVLAFPGFFRGLLDAGAHDITDEMMIAAAMAISDVVSTEELNPSFIVPSVFDASVAPAVAAAVRHVVSEGRARARDGDD